MINPERRQCTIEEHHADPAIGSSSLKILAAETPAHYIWTKEHPRRKPTPAQRTGNLIHATVLEPARFAANFIIEPEFSGKGSRSDKEAFHLEHHGKFIVDAEECARLKFIVKNVQKHKQASKLIAEGHAEESIFWTDPTTSLRCKARPDFKHAGHVLVDVKSTSSATVDAFKKKIAEFGIHIQGAFYCDGATITFDQPFDEFVTIVIEQDGACAVNVFSLGIETLQEGRALYMEGLQKYKQCLESNVWPAFDDSKIHTIGLPTWAYRNAE